MSLSSDVALGVRVVRGVAYRPVTLRALAPTAGGRVADAIRSGGKVGGADLVSLAVSIGAGTYTPPPPPQPVVPPQTALEGLAENKAVGAVVSLAQGDVGGAIGGIASAAVEPILGVIDTAQMALAQGARQLRGNAAARAKAMDEARQNFRQREGDGLDGAVSDDRGRNEGLAPSSKEVTT